MGFNLFGRKVLLNTTNVIYYLTTVNVLSPLCTSILRCVRVVIISKHNFLCASQHVKLTSAVYNNNQGLTLCTYQCKAGRGGGGGGAGHGGGICLSLLARG